MPTLYDNFSQVKQYIDQEKPDLTSYVTKTELANCSYVTSDVKELTGPLYITYQETNNALYGFKSYSHIVAGDENKTTPAFLASKRYCANGVGSYINMASFFVNSDGRAKFGHKASAGGGGDDSFMCFNAYGFKVAYSGAAGTAATTEYEILHEGNIGNLGYATTSYVADYVAEHGGGGSAVIDENIIPKETNTYTLGDSSYLYAATYTSRVKVGNNSQMYNDGGGITFSINSNNGVRIGSSTIYPKTSGGFSLGSSINVWNSTYTSNLYAPTSYSTYIVGPQGHINLNESLHTPFVLSYDVNGTPTKIIQLAYRSTSGPYPAWKFAPLVNEDVNLGGYTTNNVTQWGCTYTKSLYLDGTPIQSIINSLFSYDTTTGTLTITTL